MTVRIPLILDVDTGIDDALALALALRSPNAELVAVTTLAGNVTVERATANTLAVLDWLGATDVPVHRGASRPLVRLHHDATYHHDVDGLGNAGLPPSSRSPGADRGPAAIVRLASSRPGEITLVCAGPLTNLAIALNVEPRLPDLLSRVVVMGGAYDVPGNVTPTAEFNIYADPEAAAQVFEAPFRRIAIVGLDVTHRTPWPRTAWEAAVQAAGADPAARLAVAVCRQAFVERSLAQVYLHDPLAVAVALDPTLVNQENTSIVVGRGDEDRGVTRAIGPGTVGVAKAVDVRSFLSRFASALHLPDWSSLGSSWELGPGVAKTTAAAPRRPPDR